MLYFKALLEGLSTNLPNADQAIRKIIEQKAEYEGWEAVYAELCEVDPLAGQKFRVSDRQRITRALEVFISLASLLQNYRPNSQKFTISLHIS